MPGGLRPTPKFVQIATSQSLTIVGELANGQTEVHALDEDGGVWHYNDEQSTWYKLSTRRFEE